MPRIRPVFLAALVIGFSPVTRALTFEFNHNEAMDPSALAGFLAAAARWSAVFSDPITITLDIGFGGLGAGVLAEASSDLLVFDYTQFQPAITADRTSANDFTAVASLPGGSAFDVRLNHTTPDHTDATPYTGSSTGLVISRANARALGLVAASGGASDAAITFGTAGFTWDFDPSNGITSGAYDFVGAATHEIGHALGFSSGVDYLDTHLNTLTEGQTYQTPIDMFRYSTQSITLGLIDGTVDDREKYFSLDGGTTTLGTFSSGLLNGDGQQASHWKDSLSLGIMDPTATTGELLSISALDLVAFDVMGYDLASVPEPADLALWGAAVVGAVVAWRRRCARIEALASPSVQG